MNGRHDKKQNDTYFKNSILYTLLDRMTLNAILFPIKTSH